MYYLALYCTHYCTSSSRCSVRHGQPHLPPFASSSSWHSYGPSCHDAPEHARTGPCHSIEHAGQCTRCCVHNNTSQLLLLACRPAYAYLLDLGRRLVFAHVCRNKILLALAQLHTPSTKHQRFRVSGTRDGGAVQRSAVQCS
jgi:hypothetical protein